MTLAVSYSTIQKPCIDVEQWFLYKNQVHEPFQKELYKSQKRRKREEVNIGLFSTNGYDMGICKTFYGRCCSILQNEKNTEMMFYLAQW